MYFFEGDFHGFHANIIKYCQRPFANLEEMHETLIRNHNSVVGKDDTTVHVGDFCFSKDKRDFDSLVRRLNGKHTFIKGSHDYSLPANHPTRMEFVIEGVTIIADHYPLLVWPKSHYGSELIFAHIHRGTLPFAAGKCYNVGVDVNNFTPVSFVQLQDIMSKLPDNHNLLKDQSRDRQRRF